MLNPNPGPWTIQPGNVLNERQIFDSDHQLLAIILGSPEAAHEGLEQDELNATAKLFCFANHMYRALRDVAAWFNDEDFDESDISTLVEHLLNDIEEP